MFYPTKKIGILIGIIILIILKILIFPEYFNKNSGAVQAAVTLILVVITGYYAWQTRQTVKEISNQTQIAQMPVLVLYIRDIRESMNNPAVFHEQEEARRKFGDHLIRTIADGEASNYYLSVRNVGNGPAFNLEVECQNLIATNYQSSFIAPTKDEQRFLISDRRGVFTSLADLNNKNIDIKCLDMKGASYIFKYKIVNLEQKQVKFIEKIH